MAETENIQFPASVDTFDAVENSKVVYARHINHLADATVAIEKAARNVVSTDRSAESNGSSEIRRQIILDCVTVDQQTNRMPYVDVGVTLKDNNGNPLPTDVWTNKDYAIHMDVVNTKNRPQLPPANVAGPFDSANQHDVPYNWSIVGYNGATATVRVFGHAQTVTTQPQLLATNPSRTKLYALCGGTDTSPMTMLVYDANGVFLSKIDLPTPSVTKSGLLLEQAYEGFAVSESGNIYLLWKPRGQNSNGVVIKYGPTGTLVSNSLITQTDIPWATSICVDQSEYVYVTVHTKSGNAPLCAILQFTSTGIKTGKSYTWGLDDSGGRGKYKIMLGCAYNITDGFIYITGSTRHEVSSDRDATVMIIAKWNPATNGTDYWNFDNKRNYANSQAEVDRATSGTYSMGRCTVQSDGRVIWLDRYAIPIGNGDNQTHYSITSWEKLTSYNQMYVKSAKFDKHVDSLLQFDPGFGDWTQSYFDCPNAPAGSSGKIHNGNIPYSVVAMANGWVFATCTRIADSLKSYSTYQGSAAGPILKPFESSIKCSILTTVVTAADSTVHLRLPASGNLVTNNGFAQVSNVIDSYIPPASAQRTSILLRSKPIGWGAIAVEDGMWGEITPTDMFRTTNESGMTVITTGAFATNAGTTGLGYVNDPTPDMLYIPFVWGGKHDAARDTHAEVEDFCSPDRMVDAAPVVALRTAQISGRLNVPVTDVALPRAQAEGDYIALSFTHWSHLLYKIQNQSYDARLMKSLVFLQYLDADGTPLQVWNDFGAPVFKSNGDPLYHYDFLLSSGDTSVTPATKVSSVIKPTHTYAVYGPTNFYYAINIPTGTRKVRIGFVGGVRSTTREDNVLSDVGESGGLFIDNVSLILANALRP